MMLSPKNLGLAGGILKGLCVFLTTLLSIGTGFAHNMLLMMTEMWPGYSITAGGSVIGLIYGFISGFVWLFLLAWLYNRFVSRFGSCCSNDKPKEWK